MRSDMSAIDVRVLEPKADAAIRGHAYASCNRRMMSAPALLRR